MKKYLLLVAIIPFLGGCATKIVSQKSPITNLDNKHCFILPAKDYLASQSITEQKLYELSEKALLENSFVVYHGEEQQFCKNYLFTTWTVSENDSFRTSRDDYFPGFYGRGGGIYRYGYIPEINPVLLSGTDTTYRVKRFYSNYELHVGKKDGDKIITAWDGSKRKDSSASSVDEANKIVDGDYELIKEMIETMLIENNLKQSNK